MNDITHTSLHNNMKIYNVNPYYIPIYNSLLEIKEMVTDVNANWRHH